MLPGEKPPINRSLQLLHFVTSLYLQKENYCWIYSQGAYHERKSLGNFLLKASHWSGCDKWLLKFLKMIVGTRGDVSDSFLSRRKFCHWALFPVFEWAWAWGCCYCMWSETVLAASDTHAVSGVVDTHARRMSMQLSGQVWMVARRHVILHTVLPRPWYYLLSLFSC